FCEAGGTNDQQGYTTTSNYYGNYGDANAPGFTANGADGRNLLMNYYSTAYPPPNAYQMQDYTQETGYPNYVANASGYGYEGYNQNESSHHAYNYNNGKNKSKQKRFHGGPNNNHATDGTSTYSTHHQQQQQQ